MAPRMFYHRWRPTLVLSSISPRTRTIPSVRQLATVTVPGSSSETSSFTQSFLSGIWYIPNPATTQKSTVIAQLPHLATSQRHLRKPLFLVTPGLAHWFDRGSTFHQDAINSIYRPFTRDAPPESHVAIVDKLPGPGYFSHWDQAIQRPRLSSEGIAICFLDDITTEASDPRDGSDEGSALLHISSGTVNVKSMTTLTLPTANTLFVNGRRSTMFKQAWTGAEKTEEFVPESEPVLLKSIQLRLPTDARRLLKSWNVPMYCLTPDRKVVSSMGNVVKELEGDGGVSLKASAELEMVVPKFLAHRDATSGEMTQIQVFARVLPPNKEPGETKKGNPPDELSEDPTGAVKAFNEAIFTVPQYTHRKGGSIYRVTGGGGGWGKKAGLLSLEPARNFEQPGEMASTMFPDPNAADDDLRNSIDLGTLVTIGHHIQFYAATVLQPADNDPTDSSHSNTDASSTVLPINNELNSAVKSLKGESMEEQKIVLGNVIASEVSPDTSGEDNTSDGVTVLHDSFGVLSEGGASVSFKVLQTPRKNSAEARKWKMISETRVDAPFAIFRTTISPKATRQRESKELPVSELPIRHAKADRPPTRSLVKDSKQKKDMPSPLPVIRRIASTADAPDVKIRYQYAKKEAPPALVIKKIASTYNAPATNNDATSPIDLAELEEAFRQTRSK